MDRLFPHNTGRPSQMRSYSTTVRCDRPRAVMAFYLVALRRPNQNPVLTQYIRSRYGEQPPTRGSKPPHGA
jgi:hypothetical protein